MAAPPRRRHTCSRLTPGPLSRRSVTRLGGAWMTRREVMPPARRRGRDHSQRLAQRAGGARPRDGPGPSCPNHAVFVLGRPGRPQRQRQPLGWHRKSARRARLDHNGEISPGKAGTRHLRPKHAYWKGFPKRSIRSPFPEADPEPPSSISRGQSIFCTVDVLAKSLRELYSSNVPS